MHHIIYASRATLPWEQPQLEKLLLRARAFNIAHDITGLLLYGNGQFVQVLEGEEATLRALYARIRRDPRHAEIETHADTAIAQRAFPDWQMAFQALSPQQFRTFAGYLVPAAVRLDRPALSEADQHLLAMLRSFLFLPMP